MRFLNDEKAVSEVVGAMMILLILVLYLGIMQSHQVPQWNEELEKQQLNTVYDDFVAMRSNLEDVSEKNIPKTSSFHMGVKYPQRFMLSNPGSGASGNLYTYPLRINISYETTSGTKWKNYTSMGIIYEQNGISDSPRFIYENGLIMKEFGNGFVFVTDDNQSLTSKDNIFIPILNGAMNSGSSMEIESLNIQPILNEGFSHVTFTSMNVTIETRYPKIWNNISKESRPSGSNFTIENGTKCQYGNSTDYCLKFTFIPGLDVKILNLPGNENQPLQEHIYTGMVTLDNSINNPSGSSSNITSNSRGPTGPDGQDMFDQDQRRRDIPASDKSTQFLIRDITIARNSGNNNNHDYIKLKFSVTDITNTVWEVEIEFSRLNDNTIKVKSVEQISPPLTNNATFGIYNDIYTEFNNKNITNSRELDLTNYYRFFSKITSPNVLKIEEMDDQILYVNFVIN